MRREDHTMYEEARKTAFIRDYTQSMSTARFAQRTFAALEPYERRAGKDVAQFTPEELRPVAERITGVRSQSKLARMTVLRAYVRWCMTQQIPGTLDSVFHVKIPGLDKLREKMVSGPVHLQRVLDQLYDPEDDETIDNTYRCWLWLAFAGVPRDDSVRVQAEDVDFPAQKIRFGGAEYPLYRESLPAFRNAVALPEFRYIHPHYSDRLVLRERVAGHQLLRGVKTEAIVVTLESVLSTRASKRRQAGLTEQYLCYCDVARSGLFFRTYENERGGIPPDFLPLAVAEVMGKERPGVGGENLRRMYTQRARYTMEQYQRWKLAFSI